MAAAAETDRDVLIVSLHRAMKQLQTVAEQWSLAMVQGGQALTSFVVNQVRLIARLCKKHRQKNKPTIETRLHACSPASKTFPANNPPTHTALG